MRRPARRRRGGRVQLDGGDGARQRVPPRYPCLDCLGTAGGRVRKLPRARAATRRCRLTILVIIFLYRIYQGGLNFPTNLKIGVTID